MSLYHCITVSQINMANKSKGMRIGILTAGGDCPGLNAAIRGVGKTAITEYGMKVFGFSSGFTGIIKNEYTELFEHDLSGILTVGGTILGTSREKPFKKTGNGIKGEKVEQIIKNYKDLKLDALVVIGGNGSQRTANQLAETGLNIVGIPKTIDNDVWGTDYSFGFDSALWIDTEAIDRLHTTANSHKRIMVIEVMGHHAGWLALYSGIAGGGDVILIPEVEYDEKIICDYLQKRVRQKKPYSIVVVAEGISKPKNSTAAHYIAGMIKARTGLETRETILGYIQRGGSPSPVDRLLATQYGAHAVELIAERKFGMMVAKQGENITSVKLSEAGTKLKLVPTTHPLIKKARSMDICFGDR